MSTTGKIDRSEFTFELKIKDFFSLSEEVGKLYSSPSFLFDGEPWHLNISPNGSEEIAAGWISIYLWRDFAGSIKKITCSFHLKTSDGNKYESDGNNYSFTRVFKKLEGWGYDKFCNRSRLLERKSELVPSGVLTIVCTLKHSFESSNDVDSIARAECSFCKIVFDPNYVSTHEERCLDKPVKCPKCSDEFVVRNWFDHKCLKTGEEGSVVTAECCYCEKKFDANYISCHKQKCLDKPIRCPTCSDEVLLRGWFDHECQMARMEATKKLQYDLENIFIEGEHSDVTIKVKDEEFRLHRNILAGRNPFFDSMFKTEMREKSTGIVTIDDCDPQIFRCFIHFLYVGDAGELSLENVCDLYEVADKYQADLLKEECLCFMKNKMSVDTFCDFIVLSLNHNEKELFELATELFCRKTKEIIQDVKWQTFMKEYSTQANELYIKALDFKTK